MQVPNPITFAPSLATIAEALLSVPASPGIYALSASGNPPHISWSVNLKRRLTRLLVPSYTASLSVLSELGQKVTSVSYWKAFSRLETSLVLYELTRHAYPDTYLRRLHLRMPWLVGFTSLNCFPRLEVTNRLASKSPERFGPFRTRDAAQLYQEQILALHQVRRCVDTLHPSADHPGCIYGEMNQCLRPCQCAVSVEEYSTEVNRLTNFLQTSGNSALLPLNAARERAAADLDFEQAALAHKQIERIQAANAARDKIIGPVQQFQGVALTRGVDSDSVRLWPMYQGFWQTPLEFVIAEQARSLDTLLRESLTSAFEKPIRDGNRLEHLALFSRWYYSTWRDGHWFPFHTLDKLNYRRLVKAISSLLKPDAPRS